MKKLELKKVDFFKNEEGESVNYSALIRVCLNNVPEGGYTVQEMRDRMDILNKAEKANGSLDLEDSETKKLKSCVKAMKWSLMNKEIVQFCDDVEAM